MQIILKFNLSAKEKTHIHTKFNFIAGIFAFGITSLYIFNSLQFFLSVFLSYIFYNNCSIKNILYSQKLLEETEGEKDDDDDEEYGVDFG